MVVPGVPRGRRRARAVGLSVSARLLRLLPPEAAHRLAIRALALAPPPPAVADAADPRLRTSLAGIELPHPVCLAAGFDKNAEAFAPLRRLGFAAVEVGTVTPRPQAGNPRPRLFRLAADRAVVNRLGFNNAGLEAAAVRLARRRPGPGVVGANIGMNRDAGDPVADYRRGLERLYPLVDYLTVNVSSPNTPGLRALQRREGLRPLLEALLGARERLVGAGSPPKPLLLKVAPDLSEDEEAGIAALALELRLDGLVVGNTTVSRPPTLRSEHASEAGGLSGRPLFPLSTRMLARFALRLGGRVPLVGVGGVATGFDAYAKIRAGASAVQLYTALVYEGPGVARRIVAGLDACLARDGIARLGDAVGLDAATLARGRLDRRQHVA